MMLPRLIYDWIDKRGCIPAIIKLLYPTLHWCLEWDDMLIYDGMEEYKYCYCLKM